MGPHFTSSGPRSGPVEQLRLLSRRPSARRERGLFVAEGVKLIEEALAARAPIVDVFLDRAAVDGPGRTGGDLAKARQAAEEAVASGAAGYLVARDLLDRCLDTVTPQPVAAVVAVGELSLEELVSPPEGLVLVCAGVSDPGNAGTIVRSAAASGSRAVVFCEGAVDVYNPKAVRATAGSLFHLPVVTGPTVTATLDAFRCAGWRCLSTVPDQGIDYSTCDLTRPAALFLGSESHGLAPALVATLDDRLSIPMASGTESLNVAMAATVICFEAYRQRRRSTQRTAGLVIAPREAP